MPGERPVVRGKFLFIGDRKLYVRGVTYGPFRPTADGSAYHHAERVAQDFARIAELGANTVRVYTVPPRWLLDLAQTHGLFVMVGLPCEQNIAFLDGRRDRDILLRVRDSVRACADHPAVLSYTIGNEIPASIVRWYGARRIERFLGRLYDAVKSEDPAALVTYVNYPTTEYLRAPSDFVSFNVYLESQAKLESYLARLHNLAGDRPLVLAEIGLDSRRNSEDTQAVALEWQIRTAFGAGCAGAVAFAWTDEWYHGGHDIDDWDFGLVARDGRPKPALDAVRRAFAEVPFPRDVQWPRMSVVVCTHNGHATIRETMDAVCRLEYPDFEVIVVDDGSPTDEVARIVGEYLAGPIDVRLIRTPNLGLSAARNTGMHAATGSIVAYIDDDAYPDSQWLTYLASTFRRTSFAGVGGPNVSPVTDGLVADCVARAPGGPTHVLLDDSHAEHIPGCNMAYRRDALLAVGGFDPQFRVAGDDVDLCWRLKHHGMSLGFSPAAMVWHHRRNTVRGYWKQQCGYGKAEALLERTWPEKYNAAGHIPWRGRIYASYLSELAGNRRGRIYHGTWGSALFQSLYEPGFAGWRGVFMMPEWNLAIAALGALGAIGFLWTPLLMLLPLFALALAAGATQAALSAWPMSFPSAPRTSWARLERRMLTTVLHLIQPAARLYGRMREGLTPWRRAGDRLALPVPHELTIWSESWRNQGDRLRDLELALLAQRVGTQRGGDYDRWDLDVRAGIIGSARVFTMIEEHGGGRQLMRLRVWPRLALAPMAVAVVLGGLAAGAFAGFVRRADTRAGIAGAILALLAAVIAARAGVECATAVGAVIGARDTMAGATTIADPATSWARAWRQRAMPQVRDGAVG